MIWKIEKKGNLKKNIGNFEEKNWEFGRKIVNLKKLEKNWKFGNTFEKIWIFGKNLEIWINFGNLEKKFGKKLTFNKNLDI